MRPPDSRRRFRLAPASIAAISVAAGVLLSTAVGRVPAAHAGPGDAASDTVSLVGEFVDPVCIFQHGMQGAIGRQCAMVRGRVDQGMLFLDLRQRRLYTVVGQTHWEDPRAGFLEALGDTFAVRGKVWRYAGDAAIAITEVHPWRRQPRPVYAWWPWHWEWSVLTGCGVLAGVYALGMARWSRRRRRAWDRGDTARALAFAGALLVMIGSLNGPLHDLSDRYLFSAHMIQHLLLSQLFPLLFLMGVPAALWEDAWRLRPARAVWDAAAAVPIGFALYTVVFSIWHVPVLYNLMMREHGFHIVMHLMVMVTATWMWWPVAAGAAVRRPMSPPGQLLYLFLLGIPMMAVAALITFANRSLYEWYALAPRFLGMTAADDQRLGGLIMWVPGGLFYWIVMSVVFFRWSARETHHADPVELPVPTAGAIFRPFAPLSLGKEKPVR